MQKVLSVLILFLLCTEPLLAQLDAGPNDTITSGVAVTLTATYGEIATGVTTSDDGVEGPFPIGFSFSFYGNIFDQFYIGANGWISFSPNLNSKGVRGILLPSLDPNTPKNCICGPFMDLNPISAGSPYIFYLTIGQAPNRKLVVMWCQTPLFQCENSDFATFQIVLDEGSNTIENHIYVKPTCQEPNATHEATQGIQNSIGTFGTTVPGRNHTVWEVTVPEGWKYTPTSIDSFQVAPVPFRLEPIVPGEKITYAWYQGSDFLGDGPTVTVAPNATTQYKVIATLCNGEQFTDSVTVVVLPNLPNAFSPNGDGLNDKFRVIGIPPENITKFNIEIYDRWGQMVFHSNDIEDSWDGKQDGQPCPVGLYAWVMYYETDSKTKITNKGTVMLVR
ncbi:MAG TPA: gliding motility-associated C-terminal domain-containing protein [Bacteroidales bacterium]|nr:gliding motility-associated C-terminal domain-containing protein [Bacteroidales bacterium]